MTEDPKQLEWPDKCALFGCSKMKGGRCILPDNKCDLRKMRKVTCPTCLGNGFLFSEEPPAGPYPDVRPAKG